MNTNRTCPQCGATLSAEAPEGLCPACMMKAGLPANADTVFAPLASDPLAPGEIAKLFPHLEILSELGRGGMGVVYKARQKQLDRIVALKVLPPEVARDPHFAERFLREARALAKLNHPSIVTVHEFGESGGLFFLIMEFVDGVNLRQLEQSRQITPAEALSIIPKICDALQYAHEEGVVHRDIKPENILVDKKGRVKIADFGLAKLAGLAPSDARLTQSHLVMGTPHYMAPEQTEKPLTVDHRADIYSLGVVFYEMLTGELPIGRFAPPSQKFHLDVRLDEVVLKSLEKEPERRYQQVSEVKTAVEGVTSTPPVGVLASAGEAKAAFDRQSKPTNPPTETGWRAIGLAVGVHAVVLLVIAAIMVLVVPRFLAIFRDMEVTLPWLTQGVVGCSQFVLHGGYLLLPFLVALDVLFCWLAQNTGGRKLLMGWTVAGAFGLCAVVAVVVGALSLPLQRVMETPGTQAVTTLKSFSTADPTISKDLVVENGGWLANCAEPQTIALFELPNPGVENCTVTYRAQVKTEGLKGRTYLEMWCRIPGSGESFSRSLDHVATGSMDWASYETPFFLKKGEKPDLLRINLVVEGTGRVGIRNVEVQTNAKRLPAGAGAPSAAMAHTPFTCTTNNGAITITKYTGPGGAVTIPRTINSLPVTRIGDSAFRDCASLTSVTIPDSVTSMGQNPFFWCRNLLSITVDAANPAFSSTEDGVLFNKEKSRLVVYPGGKGGSYVIPSGSTSIGDDAFIGCRLTDVTIPNSVTSIGGQAFLGCDNLTSVAVPGGVTHICGGIFSACHKLVSVTIGGGVARIEHNAFFGSDNLTAIYFKGDAPRLNKDVFEGCNKATIYYQPGAKGWGKEFGGRPTAPWNLQAK